jgi:hypothetical protein
MSTTNDTVFPHFLRSYDELNAYIRETVECFSTTDKGRTFAGFVTRVIRLSELGHRFTNVEIGAEGPDGGVDLTALSGDSTAILYGQAKLTVKKAEEIDTIMSKFHNFEQGIHANKLGQYTIPQVDSVPRSVSGKAGAKPLRKGRKALLVVDTNDPLPKESIFLIATLSRIKGRILQEYEKSSYTSRQYYDQLIAEGRLVILEGPELFPLAQSAYRKSNVLPSNITLQLADGFLHHDNVYIGVISAAELKRCYRDYGEALFLDNIRLFLGYSSKGDRENVNFSIRETAESSPREMLGRNNGITFRATCVRPVEKSSLFLERASIVNGCQTTMCVVDAKSDEAFVLVKIVETDEAWSIAKSANSQSKVDQIVLDLARYVRPQAVKMAASKAGYLVQDSVDTIYDVFNAFYKDEIVYDEIFYLFLGLFSREPTNIINLNFTEIRKELLRQLAERDPSGEDTLELLFRLYRAAIEGQARAANLYQDEESKTYKRFWKDDKADYRSVLTLLAACGAVGTNIYTQGASQYTIDTFLQTLDNLLTNDKDRYLRYYCYAFEAVVTYLSARRPGASSEERQRYMYDDLRTAPFDTLYSALRRTAAFRENDGRAP